MQASMDELEKLYEDRKQLELKIETIREEIKKALEVTQLLETENRIKERQVKNMLEKGSAEESTAIFQKEFSTMEERVSQATRKLGEVQNATHILKTRIESMKEDNIFRTKQIEDMKIELEIANKVKDDMNSDIENIKSKRFWFYSPSISIRQRLHVGIMHLKAKGDLEQKEFEEDIRWVRESDQAADTIEVLTAVKKRLEQRFLAQADDFPTEWVDPFDAFGVNPSRSDKQFAGEIHKSAAETVNLEDTTIPLGDTELSVIDVPAELQQTIDVLAEVQDSGDVNDRAVYQNVTVDTLLLNEESASEPVDFSTQNTDLQKVDDPIATNFFNSAVAADTKTELIDPQISTSRKLNPVFNTTLQGNENAQEGKELQDDVFVAKQIESEEFGAIEIKKNDILSEIDEQPLIASNFEGASEPSIENFPQEVAQELLNMAERK